MSKGFKLSEKIKEYDSNNLMKDWQVIENHSMNPLTTAMWVTEDNKLIRVSQSGNNVEFVIKKYNNSTTEGEPEEVLGPVKVDNILYHLQEMC